MPKPCWAIVRFRVDPAPRGSGVGYRSQVDKSDIDPKYQRSPSASNTLSSRGQRAGR
jgi:hypothetical protein